MIVFALANSVDPDKILHNLGNWLFVNVHYLFLYLPTKAVTVILKIIAMMKQF